MAVKTGQMYESDQICSALNQRYNRIWLATINIMICLLTYDDDCDAYKILSRYTTSCVLKWWTRMLKFKFKLTYLQHCTITHENEWSSDFHSVKYFRYITGLIVWYIILVKTFTAINSLRSYKRYQCYHIPIYNVE